MIFSTLKYYGFLIAAMLTCSVTNGQPDTPPGANLIIIDMETYTFTGDFPFDKPFYIYIVGVDKYPGTKGAVTAKFYLREGLDEGIPYKKIQENVNLFRGTSFSFIFNKNNFDKNYLLPAHRYSLKVEFFKDDKTKLPEDLIYTFTTKTKFGSFVKPDFGFAYAPNLKAMVGFTTAHFYLTPLNDDTDLKEIKSLGRQLLLRTSGFFGISPLTLTSNTEQPVKNMFGVGNFIYGVGFRSPFYPFIKGRAARILLQPMRITAGEMLFMQTDDNPLVTKDKQKKAFFIGLSYDLNISSLLGPISRLTAP